ncbi:MAG: low molecular weight phosphatase family protein [Opitutales bacterium]
MRHVLFICTGNYYRSRFAEAIFNHYARAGDLPWRAISRGLAVHLVDGDLSPQTRQALLERGIPLHHTAPSRQDLTRADLEAAAHVVALKEAEHRPLMTARFPDWAPRIEYWHVDDLDFATPAEALPAIETLVIDLARRLPAAAPAAQPPPPFASQS